MCKIGRSSMLNRRCFFLSQRHVDPQNDDDDCNQCQQQQKNRARVDRNVLNRELGRANHDNDRRIVDQYSIAVWQCHTWQRRRWWCRRRWIRCTTYNWCLKQITIHNFKFKSTNHVHFYRVRNSRYDRCLFHSPQIIVHRTVVTVTQWVERQRLRYATERIVVENEG